MASAYLRAGDCLPALTGSLQNIDESAVDLTDTTVSLELIEMATGTVTSLPAVTVGDPTLGQVAHAWEPGETDTMGAYFYHWLVTWPASGPESFPNDSRGLVLSITPG
jgi:hypothetical protein